MGNTLLWRRIENEVGRRIEEFPGVAGVCVKDLNYGDGFAIRGDRELPPASTSKVLYNIVPESRYTLW